jgi:hypothetical protein
MNDLQIVLPPKGDWEVFRKQLPLLPFADVSLEFAQELSRKLLQNGKNYPELMALGFWLRKANVNRLQKELEESTGNHIRLARGLAFHIAPANVDTQFVYSWFLSLLVGNTNVLRLPSRDSEQISILLQQIADIFAEFKFQEIAERNLLVRYRHDEEINRTLSIACDIRVLWGGDTTIRQLRQYSLSPSAKELCFVDKFSFALLDAQSVLDCKELPKLVKQFYNDAYGFEQNACSSPRLVVWLGSQQIITAAQQVFWLELSRQVTHNAPLIPLHSRMEKLVAQFELALQKNIKILPSDSAFLNRVWYSKLTDIPQTDHCGGGLFYESKIEKLDELTNIFSKKIQTISVFGINLIELSSVVYNPSCNGVDRIVYVGDSLSFSHHWDGINLLTELSRTIHIKAE